MRITNSKILIIGGTGSLGNKLTENYLSNNNEIYLYSRDECKHWAMEIDYNRPPNLHFIIGNIADKEKIKQTIVRHNFDIIIMAAALKHIDKCEFETNECINTNLLGTKNVLDEIENNLKLLTNLKSVCFVSTDKACSPVNIYGMTKAASECLMIEKAKYIKSIKFVCVRYGNVLNSRGSIIPMLHKIGQNENIKHFTLTDPRMTRFVMTLSQSVALVNHAILHATSGDVVIPHLVSCNIKDLLDIFSSIYDKPVVRGILRPGEKMLESLINETQSLRVQKGQDGYLYIRPPYTDFSNGEDTMDYNSTINPLSAIELKEYLEELNLLDYVQ
jgi:UDP-N-acetylglucosamine 4,6-dehydratase/5-epimerase